MVLWVVVGKAPPPLTFLTNSPDEATWWIRECGMNGETVSTRVKNANIRFVGCAGVVRVRAEKFSFVQIAAVEMLGSRTSRRCQQLSRGPFKFGHLCAGACIDVLPVCRRCLGRVCRGDSVGGCPAILRYEGCSRLFGTSDGAKHGDTAEGDNVYFEKHECV